MSKVFITCQDSWTTIKESTGISGSCKYVYENSVLIHKIYINSESKNLIGGVGIYSPENNKIELQEFMPNVMSIHLLDIKYTNNIFLDVVSKFLNFTKYIINSSLQHPFLLGKNSEKLALDSLFYILFHPSGNTILRIRFEDLFVKISSKNINAKLKTQISTISNIIIKLLKCDKKSTKNMQSTCIRPNCKVKKIDASHIFIDEVYIHEILCTPSSQLKTKILAYGVITNINVETILNVL